MGWLDVGAGAGIGLQEKLANDLAQERMRQSGLLAGETVRHNQASEALAGQRINEDAAYRHELEKQRLADQIDRQVSLRGIGDPVSEGEYQRETAAGVPGGMYNITPGKSPVGTLGFVPLDRGQAGASVSTAEPGSPLSAPRVITSRGTGAQRATAAAQDLRAQDTERRLQEMQDKANQAWERLRLEGANRDAVDAFHQAQMDLARTKAEHAQELAASKQREMEAKTPQPQFFRDATGKTHAVVFDKGAMKEIPLPAGYEPTKAAAPGIFERLRGWFGGGDESNDLGANWGAK